MLATAYIEYKYEKIAKNGHFGVLDGPLLITRLSWNYTHFFLGPPKVCVQNLKFVGCIVCCPWTLKNRQIQKSGTYRYIHTYIYIDIWQKTGFAYYSETIIVTDKQYILSESCFKAHASQIKLFWKIPFSTSSVPFFTFYGWIDLKK